MTLPTHHLHQVLNPCDKIFNLILNPLNEFLVPSYTSLGIPSKDEPNGLRDYSSYGLHPYAAYPDLVHPYSHHNPVLGHHTGKYWEFKLLILFTFSWFSIVGQHLHAQQMAMTLGGIAGVSHQPQGEQLPPPLRRERKRKSEQVS
jgi:hypothetical protein